MNERLRSLTCLPVLALTLSACSLAPDYNRPTMDIPTAYKEDGPWRPAAAKIKNPEKWWRVFGDPQLDKLEEELLANNQNLKAAEAQYRAARAAVDEARSGLFPTIGLSASATRGTDSAVSSGSTSSGVSSGGKYTYSNIQTLSAQASWELDLWGRIRSGVDAAGANMEASEGALGAAQLSAEALLAQTYFQLRAYDAQIAMLNRTVAAYERYLQVTRNRLTAGVASPVDVAQAETQLNTALTQLSDAKLLRSQYEHAVSVLVGKPPSALTIASGNGLPAVPAAPALVPSTVLESRYDIFQAERQVAAANAQIGVARAAFFPIINLSADAGYSRSFRSGVFSAPTHFWSIGPSLALNLIDAGARRAVVTQAEAALDQASATYRQTVLTAFQEVEDNLSATRLLSEESVSQQAALAAARKSREIYENQYKAGIVGSLNVITAQTTELSAEINTISIWNRRMAAAVQLYKNLGGRQINPQAVQSGKVEQKPADKPASPAASSSRAAG